MWLYTDQFSACVDSSTRSWLRISSSRRPVTYRLLVTLVILAHERRGNAHVAAKDRPTAAWPAAPTTASARDDVLVGRRLGVAQ
jgi:hypothetical protein